MGVGEGSAGDRAAGGTTGTLLASDTDIVTVVTGVNGIDLRGQNPFNTGIVLDGIEVPQAYHFGAIRPIVPAGLLEETSFYPGSFPLEYGDATGGARRARVRPTRSRAA